MPDKHTTTAVGGAHYRIIPTKFPPINFFERYTPPELMDEAYELESLTNERLLNEIGQLNLIPNEDRISGPGASIIMAAFTHIGFASRFTDGSFGVYYAANSLKTAIYETTYHRERFLSATSELPCELDMRAYKGEVLKPLVDIRGDGFEDILDMEPSRYQAAQIFAAEKRAEKHWGIVYPSVRDKTGQCIAVFRPPALSIPVQSAHLSYHWNGQKINAVFEKTSLLLDQN